MRPARFLASSVAIAVGTAVAVLAPPVHATAASVTATLVATRATSGWETPSPDPAGITYRPDINRLIITDSEVDEMAIYNGVNVFAARLDGTSDPAYNGTTLPHSKEPTGTGYKPNDGILFVSDDDADTIFMFTKGADDVHGTRDDTVTRFHTRSSGNTDAEGAAVDLDVTNDGHVYVVDGTNNDVFDYFWGPNKRFDGVPGSKGCRSPCDDTVTSFDVGQYGARDPEGIEFFPSRNTILVLEHKSKKVYEVTRQGALLNVIDVAAAGATNPAGLALAPPSSGTGPDNMYMVDRGVDNDTDPTENDGKVYEMALPVLAPVPGQDPAPGNAAPTVDAGPDQTVTLPASASLDGTVTDSDGPPPLTTAWAQVSGPGTVTFGEAAAVDTTASFSAAGSYVLRLTGTDGGGLSGTDDVAVTVNPDPGGGGGETTTLERPVAAGSDDAEQVGTGSPGLISTDLSLGQDGTTIQTAGMRFTGVAVPTGATITRAYIQFRVDETNTAAASLRFWGEAADGSATFTTAAGDLTNRPGTGAAVTWDAPAWPTLGASGADQQSADLSAIVQEIVDRPGWASGNALSILVDGTGERTARSWEGKTAPVLHLEWSS